MPPRPEPLRKCDHWLSLAWWSFAGTPFAAPCKCSSSPGFQQDHSSDTDTDTDTYGFDTYGSYSISTAPYTLSLTVSLAPAPDLSLLTLASSPLP